MTHLIHIGNSLGLRLLKQSYTKRVQKIMNLVFKVTEDGLLISSEKKAQDGCEQKFKSKEKKIKNPSLLGEFQNEFDKDEWEW